MWFQWAPTLGGECYWAYYDPVGWSVEKFQWAPTLGGECYKQWIRAISKAQCAVSMGTHPWG